jgi:hypothetical protein
MLRQFDENRNPSENEGPDGGSYSPVPACAPAGDNLLSQGPGRQNRPAMSGL